MFYLSNCSRPLPYSIISNIIYLIDMKTKLSLLLLPLFLYGFSFAQTNSANLKVDTTISGFHLATTAQGTYFYTPNGAPDLNTENISSFAYTLLPNVSMKIAVAEIENLYNISIKNGYEIKDLVRKDTLLNGNKAFIISYTEMDKAKDYMNMLFYAVLMKENISIIFLSTDLEKGKYIRQFRNTFYSTGF